LFGSELCGFYPGGLQNVAQSKGANLAYKFAPQSKKHNQSLQDIQFEKRSKKNIKEKNIKKAQVFLEKQKNTPENIFPKVSFFII